ncbi:MAG: cytidine deaminase [Bacteroidales bacterium]|nr:cytidine deaminase [Bacteroidales bacterium]
MRKEQFICPYEVYDNHDELEPQDAELLRKAHEATAHSYAPYSKFHVGAAVRMANGEIVMGCNIENAAYPSGLCAERVALFAAQAKFPDVPVEAVAIVAHSKAKTLAEPAAPCGACRQVMLEAEQRSKRPLRVFCQGETGPVMAFDGIESLLPFVFQARLL